MCANNWSSVICATTQVDLLIPPSCRPMPPRTRTRTPTRARTPTPTARVREPIGLPRPGTYFNTATHSFFVNGIPCRGIHRTLKKWYNLGTDSAARGDWTDQFNLSRGRAVGPSIGKWIRTGCNPTTIRLLTKSAQAVAVQCMRWNIRPVAVEVPVSVAGARLATAVDLVGVYGVNPSMFTSWEPRPDDRYVIMEIKVSARNKWNARCGAIKIPDALTGQSGLPLTPALYACVQLAATGVLYRHTFPQHTIAGILIVHLYPDAGRIICNISRPPDWCTTHASREIVKRINLEQVERSAVRVL